MNASIREAVLEDYSVFLILIVFAQDVAQNSRVGCAKKFAMVL
jgi:hypothetical protein